MAKFIIFLVHIGIISCLLHYWAIDSIYIGGPSDRHTSDHPCVWNNVISQVERRRDNVINSTSEALCDMYLSSGKWYRFESPAGNQMVDECPPFDSCGTHEPIWLNGKHPDIHGTDETSYTVCQRKHNRPNDCCANSWPVHILNCSGYYVYKLHQTTSCYSSYCAGTENPCPEDLNSENGYTPGCTGNFPKLAGIVTLAMSRDEPSLSFYCDFKGRIEAHTILVVDWYVSAIDEMNTYLKPTWTDVLVERKRSVLREEWIKTKLGSNVYCEVRSKWKNVVSNVLSKPLRSETVFAGIKIFNRIINVSESGGVGVIQLQSSIPIKCLDATDNCKIVLELAYNEPNSYNYWSEDEHQVVFGDCSIELTPNNWQDIHNVTVKAVSDFMNDGPKKIQLTFRKIYTTVASDIWNAYQIPPIDIMVLDVKTAMCSSYGDPHIQTFDGTVYDVFLEGEFVMYINKGLRTKIHIRTQRCFNAACNCAVAVAVDDDVVVVDKCNRRNRKIASGSNFPEGWNTLHRHTLEQGNRFVDGLRIFEHDEGRRYTIHTPSGAYIDMQMIDEFINVNLFASSEDFNSSYGLCGSFDGKPGNDISLNREDNIVSEEILACGSDQRVCDFVEHYRVPEEDSLFGKVVNLVWPDAKETYVEEVFCTCNLEGNKSVVVCGAEKAKINSESKREMTDGRDISKKIRIKGRNRFIRDTESSDDDYDVDSYFESDFVFEKDFVGQIPPSVNTPKTGPKPESQKICHESIFVNADKNCKSHISHEELTKMFHTCVTDIELSGSTNWDKASTLQSSKSCINNLAKNASLWVPVKPPQHQPTSTTDATNATAPVVKINKILSNICPNNCSNNGKCENRKCFCKDGFEGEFCTVDSSLVPQNLKTEKFCDHHKSNCKKFLIIGKNFMKKDEIVCSFKERTETEWKHNVTATFDTYETIFCLSPYQKKVPFHLDLAIGIQKKSYFKVVEHIFVYDSKCLNCVIDDEPYHCHHKTGTCYIEKECFAEGEQNPINCCETCQAFKSNNTFNIKSNFYDLTTTPDVSITNKDCSVKSPMTFTLLDSTNCDKIYMKGHLSPHCNQRFDVYEEDNEMYVQLKSCGESSTMCQFDLTVENECLVGQTSKVYRYNFLLPKDDSENVCVENVNLETYVVWNVKPGEIIYNSFQSYPASGLDVSYVASQDQAKEVNINGTGYVTYKSPNYEGREQFQVYAYSDCFFNLTKVDINIH